MAKTTPKKRGRPATNEGRKRMSIFLEPDTHEAVRLEAARRDVPAQSLIDSILKKTLKVA